MGDEVFPDLYGENVTHLGSGYSCSKHIYTAIHILYIAQYLVLD